MPNSGTSVPDYAASLTPGSGATSDRTEALAAYVALVQRLGDLSQADFDTDDSGALSPVTVVVRIVS